MSYDIYQVKFLKQQEDFYGSILTDYEQFPVIQDHLSELAHALHQGLNAKKTFLYPLLNNYNEDYIGIPTNELEKKLFTLLDARNTIAQEYGFKNWSHLSQLKPIHYQIEFQKAINFLLEGNETELKRSLSKNPELCKTRSNYGHQASILHYTASNGVEFWRQKVPKNLPSLTVILLQHGSNKNDLMKVYGGKFNSYQLMTTSAHPKAAGLLDEMSVLLKTCLLYTSPSPRD